MPRRELGEALSLLVGRGTRGGPRHALPWMLAASWIALAVFCGQLVFHVRELRREVAVRVERIDAIHVNRDAARRAVLNAAHAEPAPSAPERARLAALLELRLRSGPETKALRLAARAWRDAEPVDRAEAARALSAAGRRYDESMEKALELLRAGVAMRSARLGALWDNLYLLAAVCIALGGAFTWVFAQSLRQRDRLELGTRAQRKLIETVQSVLFVTSADGKKAFVNETARAVFGAAPEEFIGEPLLDWIDPKLRDQEAGTFAGALQGERVFNHETIAVDRAGRRFPVLLNATAIRDQRGRPLGLIGTASDIGELKSMQQQLLRAERQNALGTMASGVAHDFSNLLTVILGKAERELAERPRSRRMLAIRDTAERARRIVERLLLFSEQRVTARSRLDLAATVERMESFLSSLLGDRGTIVLQLPGEEVLVDADWSQVEQIVMNLTINARDAIEVDGTIHVRVERLTLDEARAREWGIEPGTWGAIVVTDDGDGMDTATLGRAFEPFFTTKERGQGTGLGLATVEGIVQQHGGVVHAQSRAGEGTQMTVLLPLSVPAAALAT